jgi:predicted  nucleic acid-binding Zn-ribbon protein
MKINKNTEITVLFVGLVGILCFIGFLVFQATEYTKTSVEQKRIKLDSTLLHRIEKLENQDSLIIQTLSNISEKIDVYQSKQSTLLNNHNALKFRLKKIESKQDNLEVIE